ncbi:hypothetical protein HYH03_013598 [Edaphochlamys debaryana]|uniref:Uncharacterized protein n=1 Tax=Edaphochlamys debaryana TaxID=47281 RepID=A0A836BUA6_9CHLO|nr:hypothetical protein HYH03_013598 [Edaphochlamys debaryana]|eukprot:KAG2487753.1 hypothetical protein HYH03_013598 [Edaphochlamys debaryana]
MVQVQLSKAYGALPRLSSALLSADTPRATKRRAQSELSNLCKRILDSETYAALAAAMKPVLASQSASTAALLHLLSEAVRRPTVAIASGWGRDVICITVQILFAFRQHRDEEAVRFAEAVLRAETFEAMARRMSLATSAVRHEFNDHEIAFSIRAGQDFVEGVCEVLFVPEDPSMDVHSAEFARRLAESGLLEHAARLLLLDEYLRADVRQQALQLYVGLSYADDELPDVTQHLRTALGGRCVQTAILACGIATLAKSDGGSLYGLPRALCKRLHMYPDTKGFKDAMYLLKQLVSQDNDVIGRSAARKLHERLVALEVK